MAITQPNQVGSLQKFEDNFMRLSQDDPTQKVDQIILNSSQKLSASSKYNHILDALLIRLGSWKLAYNSRMT